MSKPHSILEVASFTISDVAKLTGVSEHCLRIWERRYSVVEPIRTEARRRRYTQNDLERLFLIKYLIDKGNTISTVANLTLEELQARTRDLENSGKKLRVSQQVAKKVVIVGGELSEQISASGKTHWFDIVGLFSGINSCTGNPLPPGTEVIIFDLATVHPPTLSAIGEILAQHPALRSILIYGSAAQQTLDQIDSRRISTIKSPADLHTLRIACTDPRFTDLTHRTTSTPSFVPRLYDVDELAKLASSSPVAPHDLISLIFDLNSFSEDNKSKIPNGDPDLQNYVHAMTSRARAIIEECLARVTGDQIRG